MPHYITLSGPERKAVADLLDSAEYELPKPLQRVRKKVGGDGQRPPITRGDLMELADIADLIGLAASTMRQIHREPSRYPGYSWLPEPIGRIGSIPVWDRAAVEAAYAEEIAA